MHGTDGIDNYVDCFMCFVFIPSELFYAISRCKMSFECLYQTVYSFQHTYVKQCKLSTMYTHLVKTLATHIRIG